MAKDFCTARMDQTRPGAVEPSHAYDPPFYGTRQGKTWSQVIAETTRGADAGMAPADGGKKTKPGPLTQQRAKPDWRGHYLGQDALPQFACDIPPGQVVRKDFDPNQPRDEIGRWTDAGGGMAAQATELARIARGKSLYHGDHAGLSERHWGSINHYVDSGYGRINRELAGTRAPSWGALEGDDKAKLRSHIAHLDQAMERFTANQDFQVWRGGRDWDRAGWDNVAPGKELTFKTFLSTSMDERATAPFLSDMGKLGDTHYRILVPKGAHMLPVSAIMPDTTEGEIILPRNSKFVVDKIDKSTHEVWLRMVL